MRCTLWLFILLIGALLSLISPWSALRAQTANVRVRAALDTTSLRLGEQTTLRLSVTHPPYVQVEFPFVGDTLPERVEVIARGAVDSTQKNGIVTESQTFTISSFEEGLHEIPALTFTYRTANDTTHYTIPTEALALAVQGVAQDSTQSLRDIKPPMALTRTFAEIAPYLFGGLLLLGGIVWAIYYFRRRAAAKPNLGEAQPMALQRPPYEIAMQALERLRKARLWQAGDAESVKDYYTQLADILRVYIEQMYGMTTLEATTEEIIVQFRALPSVPAASADLLRSVLTLADMVKFARTTPLPDDNERAIRLATEFITLTAIVESPVAA